jgi:hypothetical protein
MLIPSISLFSFFVQNRITVEDKIVNVAGNASSMHP